MIEIEGLTKRFGETAAVTELSFSVDPGRVTGLLGPNGAGKSTTLRALVGLVRPDSGSATILGQCYRELARPLERVGTVLEASTFHRARSGRDHLRVLAVAARLPLTRVDEVLQLVELSEAGRRRVGGYSLGMRQRLALAAALLGDPEVLILDEPANGLDPRGMRWLRDRLRALAAEGRTVLVSSHVLAEMAQTADDVVIIGGGRLVARGSVEELSGSDAHTRVRTPESDRLASVLAGIGIASSSVGGAVLLVASPPDVVGEAAAAAGIVLHELVAERPSLEQTFLELTGDVGA